MIGHFIDGRERESRKEATFDDVNPWTQQIRQQVALGDLEDVDAAVTSARRAFDEGPWPRMGYGERGAILHRLADLIEAHTKNSSSRQL